MKNILKIKADFSFRQGELWYFRLNRFEIEQYNGKKPKSRRGIWYSKPAERLRHRKAFTVVCCETLFGGILGAGRGNGSGGLK